MFLEINEMSSSELTTEWEDAENRRANLFILLFGEKEVLEVGTAWERARNWAESDCSPVRAFLSAYLPGTQLQHSLELSLFTFLWFHLYGQMSQNRAHCG